MLATKITTPTGHKHVVTSKPEIGASKSITKPLSIPEPAISRLLLSGSERFETDGAIKGRGLK